MTINFDPTADYILEDDRVLLKPLQQDDLQHLLPFALKETDTWKYSLENPAGEEGMTNYIQNALANRAAGIEYPFIVFDKQSDTYVGSTRFYDIQPVNKTLQLGYTWYGQKSRGTGLNKHCKFLMLQLAFDRFDMTHVELRADTRNKQSIAAMKSIGCKEIKIIKNHMLLPDGTSRDSIILRILKSEWNYGVKEQLKNRLK
jgi:RimJ/RimL family protein N-acetyltransferase